jgi:hypothetical protein
LEVLWLEKCEGVNEMDGIAWVDGLTGLKSLSFRHCSKLDSESLSRANEERWHVKELILPFTPGSPGGDILEVDPAFK